jgi:histone-lysine N-methyltransferase SETMAR
MPQKVTKGVLFLHDSILAHWALANHKKLAYLGFQCLYHPPYSPELALSDYHLYPGLTILKGHHFLSNMQVTAAAETWQQ